jgi:signal transduction histidine kinase
MKEVSCRMTATVMKSMRARGIDLEHMVDGLPFDLETLEDPGGRITWDQFLRVLENMSELLGGPDGLEEICSTFYPQNEGLVKELARQALSPRTLYHIGRWYGAWLLPCTHAECVDLPDGRLVQTIEIQPDHEDSDLFFRCMAGALRTVPSLLGLPPADVKMERSPRKAAFTVTPPRIGRWDRLKRMLRRRRASAIGANEELTLHFEEFQRGYHETAAISAALDENLRSLDEAREERERIERMLQQVQKLDAMGQLAAGIAHDFNNVLTAISGYAELAIDQLEDEHPVHSDVAEIRDVAERGAALVQQILRFSRRQEATPQHVELNAATLRMQTLLARLLPEEIRLEIVPADAPLHIVIDPGQLEQVVINLVINARDAMPDGGVVRVQLAQGEAEDGSAIARLDVSDTGRGMSEDVVAHAFEPFFTTKAHDEGTGLGLTTVHGIVCASEGVIDLESTEGEGTRFEITWPLAPEKADLGAEAPAELEALDGATVPPREAAPGGTETVLLVEDQGMVREVLERTLASAGYTVLSATEAEEAVGLARAHPTAIDLLVTDVGLQGEPGSDLPSQIAELRSELRGALLLTGHEPHAVAVDTPANQIRLTKPFDRPTLLRAARSVLDA